jgi:hypothetical protein
VHRFIAGIKGWEQKNIVFRNPTQNQVVGYIRREEQSTFTKSRDEGGSTGKA